MQSVLITRLKQEYFRIEIIDKNACRDEQEMRRMKEKGYVILFIFFYCSPANLNESRSQWERYVIVNCQWLYDH